MTGDAPTPAGSAAGRARWRPAGLWQWLTEPAAAIHSPERRRRARLLSSLLVVTLGLGLLAIILTALDINPTPKPVRDGLLRLAVVAVLLLSGAYTLSRSRRHILAAALTVSIVLVATFGSAIVNPGIPLLLAFLILGGLMSGLFLAPWAAAVVFAATLAGMLLLPILVSAFPVSNMVNALFFVFMVGALEVSAAGTRQRDQQQIEQQSTALAEREERLRAALLSADEANQRLRASVSDLEQHDRETTLLAELGELLQACATAEEAYQSIVQSTQRLFPDEAGVLYVYSASRIDLEPMATWGETPAQPDEGAFAPEACWALRRGRAHRVGAGHPNLACRHLPQPPPTSYLCVPMMVRGETLGVLHLRRTNRAAPRSDQGLDDATELNEQLAVAVSRHIAMALANLKLWETLRSQSIRDPLTGLFNRRYLEETLEREIGRAGRSQLPLGVIMIDLDHFKDFNDTFGHEAGDAVLRGFGAFLERSIRAGDIACRYGGEEFVLLLPEASVETTWRRADVLRAGVRELNVRSHNQLLGVVTLSAGVAAFPEHAPSGQALVRAADQALYQAKAQGRDRVIVAARVSPE